MGDSDRLEVKIIGSSDLIKSLEEQWSARSSEVELVPSRIEKDSSAFQMGVDEIVSLVAVIKPAIFLGELGIKIYNYLKNKNNQDQRVVIQTPLGRCEFIYTDELDVAIVQESLKQLLRPGKSNEENPA